ncbi:MAG: T9SS type A sorting domain-containing protein [Candidatus Kapabacteria bacterium]|nr:T9SS type A sorting domain-containing protein [Candidatus Kapabacteria bacterium]
MQRTLAIVLLVIVWCAEVWSQTALPAPMLLQPPDKAENTPLFTTLEWSLVQGATFYDLHVSGDPVFFTTVQRDSMIAPTITRRTIGEIFPGTTVYWRVRARRITATEMQVSEWSQARSFTAMRLTSIQNTLTYKAALHVAPNPVQNLVTVKFTLPKTERVSLNVYNTLGQEVAHVLDETLSAGEHERSLDIRHWSLVNGAYFVRLQTSMMTWFQPLRIGR